MEYVTTFNNIFFQTLAMIFGLVVIQVVFIEKIWSLTISFPKIAGGVYMFIAVAPSVYCFYNSVAGTTTALFWATIANVILLKTMSSYIAKFYERSMAGLVKAIEAKRNA